MLSRESIDVLKNVFRKQVYVWARNVELSGPALIRFPLRTGPWTNGD